MKVRGWKKLFHVNGNQKSSNITDGAVIFISEKKTLNEAQETKRKLCNDQEIKKKI